MAGRGRGMDLLKKLAKMELKTDDDDDDAATIQPTDTDATSIAHDSEIEAKFKQVDDYYRARYGDAETCGGSTTSESVGTGTFVAPFRTYMSRVRGEDSAPPSEAPTLEEEVPQSAPKFAFPMVGRGRGIFSVKESVQSGIRVASSTSDSDKQSKKLVETPEESKVSTGALPKFGGRGRGLILTSGRGTGSSDPSKDKSQDDKNSTEPKLKSIPDNQELLEEKEVVQQPPPKKAPKETINRQGKKGTPYAALTNSIILECENEYGMYEYDVRYKPALDAVRSRHACLRNMASTIGTIRTYDGGETLYLPIKLASNSVTNTITDPENGINDVQVILTFRRKRSLDECLHFYNVLFERVMDKLKYERVGRKYYDPHQPKLVPQHKLAVWPGYVKAIDELEGGLMLTLDVSHRVVNQRTVYDFIEECVQRSKRGGDGNWQDLFRKGIIGSIVSTKYNNKTYRVDDIAFQQNPSTTWKDKNEVEQSYAQYYKSQYNINIRDLKQPILVSRKEFRISGRAEKLEVSFGLIPELSNLTGLTDEMRSNFTVMKDLAQHTKLSPFQRLGSYKKFIERVTGNPAAKQLLDDWGLKLHREPVKVTARVLDDERIIFGNNKAYDIGPNADFNRQITSNSVFEAYDFTNWILVFDKRDRQTAENFENFLHKVSGPSGIKSAKARRFELPNDRIDTYVSTIRDNIKNDTSVQFVVIIFPTLRDDRYAAVKRVLCADLACPSQCINAKTLKNEAKNRSIIQKILLQINCKLGGSLWGINIPLKNTMIVGIDTYHGKTDLKSGGSVGGLVASINSSFTRYYSKPHIQGKKEELISGLTSCLVEALQCYQSHNNQALPDRLIIYRDGVGDGMLEQVRQIEINQFEDACLLVGQTYKPKITFVIVQKNVNMKFFKMLDRMKEGLPEVANPPPGSVLDNTITRRYFYDFYLCAQHVREGTTTPSHYVVLRDDCNFEPDILQKLTYKLTYMYYNWPGAVRVPAPCQYAHKLVELIGAAVQRQPHVKLNDKLYFL